MTATLRTFADGRVAISCDCGELDEVKPSRAAALAAIARHMLTAHGIG